MVKLKFIVRSNALVLRISEGGERYYKSVRNLLKGTPKVDRHWDDAREKFTRQSPFSSENNKILDDYKAIYHLLVMEHPEMSAKQILQYYSSEAKESRQPTGAAIKEKDTGDINIIDNFLSIVIEREKVKQGCNFEIYHKLQRKCHKILKGYPNLKFQDIDYDKCVSIANIFAKYKGYKWTSKAFRNLLGKASKDSKVEFSMSQIGEFKFAQYDPNINEIDTRKPDVLTPEQLKKFLTLDKKLLVTDGFDSYKAELCYDFCVFMFNSFFAPCDVMKLRHKDITKNHMIHIKRKKTHKPLEVPLSPMMEIIVNKYQGKSKYGYVFPILDDGKNDKYKTKEYLLKKFRESVNVWLKHIGRVLNTDYPLPVFRT